MSKNLDTARALAAVGCPVFPCDPVNERPRVEDWSAASTTDVEAVEELWQRFPGSLPAIDLAKAGLLVLELWESDTESGDGVFSLGKIRRAHGWKVDYPMVSTPDAVHAYLRQPEGEPLGESDAGLRPYGIVLYGKGGYVIAAGAERADGEEWVDIGNDSLLRTLARHAVPAAPDWLAALIREAASGSENGAGRPLAELLPAPPADAWDDDDDLDDAEENDPLWQQPDLSYLGSGRVAPPAFPLDTLGEPWGSWCAAHAQARSVPVDYIAGTLLAATAALIGNRRWPQASSEWREPPVLWVALVGAPSSGKTAAQEPVLDLVRAIERDGATRLLISAATTAAVGPLLRGHPAGLLLHRDELGGWLGRFNRYAGDGSEREMWLASHGGRSYCIDRARQAEPIRIPHLTVGILGSIAPDKLAAVVRGPADGIAARFLWCWPDPAPGCSLARAPIKNARMIEALRRISKLPMSPLETGDYGPRPVALLDAAAAAFESVARTMTERAPTSLGDIDDVLRRAPSHCLRLAMILRFLDWAPAPDKEEPHTIEREHVERAARLVESYFMPMARRAFGEAAIPSNDQRAMTLARWLRERRVEAFNASKARAQIAGRLREAVDMDRACAALVEAGLIRPRPSRRGPSKGRLRRDYEVNPALQNYIVSGPR